MTMLIKDHQNISEDQKFYGKMLTRANIGMAQIVVTTEMVIYAFIFWELYKVNKKPGLGLSKEVPNTFLQICTYKPTYQRLLAYITGHTDQKT